MVQQTSCAKRQQKTSHRSIQSGSVFVSSRFCSRQHCQQVSLLSHSSALIQALCTKSSSSFHPLQPTSFYRHNTDTFSHLWASVKCRAMVSERLLRCSLKEGDSYLRSPYYSMAHCKKINLLKTSRVVMLPKLVATNTNFRILYTNFDTTAEIHVHTGMLNT